MGAVEGDRWDGRDDGAGVGGDGGVVGEDVGGDRHGEAEGEPTASLVAAAAEGGEDEAVDGDREGAGDPERFAREEGDFEHVGVAARRGDKDIYRDRNVVERCFARLKQFRALATRYAKRVAYYRSQLVIATIALRLRDLQDTP